MEQTLDRTIQGKAFTATSGFISSLGLNGFAPTGCLGFSAVFSS